MKRNKVIVLEWIQFCSYLLLRYWLDVALVVLNERNACSVMRGGVKMMMKMKESDCLETSGKTNPTA
jgi:hypothetical protein